MKVLVKNYSFNVVNKTVTLHDYDKLKIEQFLLITNTTRNKIIYNFAKLGFGGSITFGNPTTLTLETSLDGMASQDSLQIFIDVPVEAFNTTIPSLSNRAVLSAAAIYEVNGISTFGQFQFFQIRSGLNLDTSTLLYSCYLKPTDNFNIKFDKGLIIPSGVVQLLNSTTPTSINLNNNNLLFTASYIK